MVKFTYYVQCYIIIIQYYSKSQAFFIIFAKKMREDRTRRYSPQKTERMSPGKANVLSLEAPRDAVGMVVVDNTLHVHPVLAIAIAVHDLRKIADLAPGILQRFINFPLTLFRLLFRAIARREPLLKSP